MSRLDDLANLAKTLGGDVFKIIDQRDGWPALCEIRVGERWARVAVHVGVIGLSGRGRDDVERRFQNPGQDKPMTCPPGYRPLLVGVQYDDGGEIVAVAGMNAAARLGKTTRFSLFLPLSGLRGVPISGWMDHVSSSGESIHLFRPELLPIFAAIEEVGIVLPEIPEIVEASGMLSDPGEEASERARRAALRAVRRGDFGRKVVQAYGGLCAMCELDQDLIEGAHIYPVQAPSSPDALWNGVALCPNHHRAFDRHRIHVHPDTLSISLHPALKDAARNNNACKALVDVTQPELARPQPAFPEPKPEMFERRYEFFGEAYQWAAG